MTAERRRKNITIGVGFIAIGMVFAGGSVFGALDIMKRQADPGTERYEEYCVQNARRLGFSVLHQGHRITITGDGDISPRIHMNRATTLLGFCPKHSLQSLCAGQECGNEAVAFNASLTLIEDVPEGGRFLPW